MAFVRCNSIASKFRVRFNVFGSSSGVSTVRFNSTVTNSGTEQARTSTNSTWWKPSFWLRIRNYNSDTRELNFIDFIEESNDNCLVPLEMHLRLINAKDDKILSLVRENAVLSNNLEILQKKIDSVLIPLTVREYANVIRGRLPPATTSVDAESLKGKQKEQQWVIKETHEWTEIFNHHSEDAYVKLILLELEKDLQDRKGISAADKSWENELEIAKKNLGEAIVRACDHANKLIAHRQSGSLHFRFALEVYDNFTDPRITIFYNAMVAKKKNEIEV